MLWNTVFLEMRICRRVNRFVIYGAVIWTISFLGGYKHLYRQMQQNVLESNIEAFPISSCCFLLGMKAFWDQGRHEEYHSVFCNKALALKLRRYDSNRETVTTPEFKGQTLCLRVLIYSVHTISDMRLSQNAEVRQCLYNIIRGIALLKWAWSILCFFGKVSAQLSDGNWFSCIRTCVSLLAW